MSRSTTEILVGAAMLAIAALFFTISYSGERWAPAGGYAVTAAFNRVDGLATGDEVRLSGVRIGQVESQRLDEYYRAVLTLRLDGDVALPTDSAAAIHTDGVFGSKFVVIEPGGDLENLRNGDEIEYTQDAIIVEDMLDLIISEGKARRAEAGTGKSEGVKP